MINLDAIAGAGRTRLEIAGRRAAVAEHDARRDRGGARARADGVRAAATERARPADRPRLPVQLLRAGAVPRSRDLGDHAHVRGRPPAERHDDRLTSSTPSASGRSAAPRSNCSRRSTRGSSSRRARRATSTSGRASSAAGRSSSCSSRRCCRSSRPPSTCSPLTRRRRISARARPLRSLSQPARLLALGRRSLRALRTGSASGRTGGSAARAASSSAGRNWPVLGLRCSASSRSPAGSSRATGCCRAAVRRGGGARRPRSRAARARRRRAARRRDEPVRAHLPAALAARLALAAAGARRRPLCARWPLLVAGFAGPAASRDVRDPLRPRARRALVRPRAAGDRLDAAARAVPDRGLAWAAAAAQLARRSPPAATPPYPACRERPPRGPIRNAFAPMVLSHAITPARLAAPDEGPGGTRVDEALQPIAGTLLMVAAGVDRPLGGRRLALAGPVHRALHALEAAPARAELRQARSKPLPPHHRLRERRPRTLRPARPRQASLAAAADRGRRDRLRRQGDPIGRIRVPRLGLNMVSSTAPTTRR